MPCLWGGVKSVVSFKNHFTAWPKDRRGKTQTKYFHKSLPHPKGGILSLTITQFLLGFEFSHLHLKPNYHEDLCLLTSNSLSLREPTLHKLWLEDSLFNGP